MIAVVVVGIIAYVTQLEIEKVLLNQERVISRVGTDSIERRSTVNYQKLLIAVSQITYNDAIIEAFAKRDREEIARLTSPLIGDLTDANIDIFNFYLPDNNVFYQVNEPVKNGNDSSFQQSVIEVNENLHSIKGLECGKFGLAFTRIRPVYYGNTYLGAVELGLPFDHRILNIFKRISGGEWFIYSMKGESDILLSATSDKEPPVKLPKANIQNILQGESVFLNMEPYLLEAIPLKDYAGNVRWYVKRIFDNSQTIQMAAQQRNRIIGYGLVITLIGFSTIFFLMLYLLKPLGYLVEKAKAFTAGDLSQEIKLKAKDEIGQLAVTMEKMRQSIVVMACYDPLTLLGNRKLFMERLHQEISRAGRNGMKLALLYLDLDKFKEINDNFGHEAGDKVLCEVGSRLKNLLRGSDLVFRLGGDEIVVILHDLVSTEDAVLVASKIYESLKEPLSLNDKLIHIKASLGLSVFPDDSDNPEELLKKADNAMYDVKKAGGNDYRRNDSRLRN
jgi:diguanylate cyclase (GGDEF)-like protein